MRVLNVAEKNDAAKNIAGHLSGGNLQRVTKSLCFQITSFFFHYVYFNFREKVFQNLIKYTSLTILFEGLLAQW